MESLAEDGKSLPVGATVLRCGVLQVEKVEKQQVFYLQYLEGVSGVRAL